MLLNLAYLDTPTPMNSQILKSLLVLIALLPNLLLAAESKPLQSSTSLANAPAAQILPLDHIVAVVNEEVITRHDLDERYARAVQQLESRKTPLTWLNILE